MAAFGPYFTDRYGTPWGEAVNFDDADAAACCEWACPERRGAGSAPPRRTGCGWTRCTRSTTPARATSWPGGRPERVHRRRPSAADRRERPERPPHRRARGGGGCGFDAQWADDFHHALHALLTGDRARATTATSTSAEDGAPAEARRAPVSTTAATRRTAAARTARPARRSPPSASSSYSQNHDQVGNRAAGDRPPPRCGPWPPPVVLSPYVPMSSWARSTGGRRFQFFTDHIDAGIARANPRRGGAASSPASTASAAEDVPDPQDPATFERSRLTRASARDARSLRAAARTAGRARPGRSARTSRRRGGALACACGGRAWSWRATSPASSGGAVGDAELVFATHEPVALADGEALLPPLAGAVVR